LKGFEHTSDTNSIVVGPTTLSSTNIEIKSFFVLDKT